MKMYPSWGEIVRGFVLWLVGAAILAGLTLCVLAAAVAVVVVVLQTLGVL